MGQAREQSSRKTGRREDGNLSDYTDPGSLDTALLFSQESGWDLMIRLP